MYQSVKHLLRHALWVVTGLIVAILVLSVVNTERARKTNHSGTPKGRPWLEASPQKASVPRGVSISQAPLRKMIGQMLLVGFVGQTMRTPDVQRIIQQVANGKIGGVIIMSRNVSEKRQLRQLLASIHAAGAETTPFVAVDQEGG